MQRMETLTLQEICAFLSWYKIIKITIGDNYKTQYYAEIQMTFSGC